MKPEALLSQGTLVYGPAAELDPPADAATFRTWDAAVAINSTVRGSS